MSRVEPSLTELITEVRGRIAELGYELVDLRKRGSGRRVALQVRLDRPDATPGHGINVDECARVSRLLETWLDASGILGERYVLEVSSPGIARPVSWREHWERYVGRDVDLRLPGRGRARARIVRVVEGRDAVVVRPEGQDEELELPIEPALDATLVVDGVPWGHGKVR